MDTKLLIALSCLVVATSAWSVPFYPVQRAPLRITRFAPAPPPHHMPIEEHQPQRQRPKRGHHDYHDSDRGPSGVTGPVHTFVKTDKNANYKWGVRHHVGDKYAS
ncbi:hypothetical protein K1T71_004667 [Dendrolimus kikuchii]|uniref:Uncharacterized protein n=1 Tax=Dendrolimus kikuchii TaxID=765133 RepID=A0ACC1D8S5_9NEOP|nr:hypothetical protein K1T71_004667 [Dendrolimus kikuchii]